MTVAKDRPIARKLVLSGGAAFVCVLLAEGAARLWLLAYPATTTANTVAAEQIETAWFPVLEQDLAGAAGAEDLYVPDAHLFWRLRPDASMVLENVVYECRSGPRTWHLTINGHGLRGPEWPDDSDAAGPVVLCLGDSCTFGFRVDDSATYPARLEGALREGGRPAARVLNLGIPGYTSFQGRRLLEDVLSRRGANVVIISFGSNDHETDRASDARKAERASTWVAGAGRLLAHLALVRLLRGRPDSARREPGRFVAESARVTPEEFSLNLTAMIHRSRAAGARVLLLDLAFVAPAYRDLIARVGADLDVEVIDGRELFRTALEGIQGGTAFVAERAASDRFWEEEVVRYRMVYYDPTFYRSLFADPVWKGLLRYLMIEPIHPSPLGHRVLAEEIARRLLRESGK